MVEQNFKTFLGASRQKTEIMYSLQLQETWRVRTAIEVIQLLLLAAIQDNYIIGILLLRNGH